MSDEMHGELGNGSPKATKPSYRLRGRTLGFGLQVIALQRTLKSTDEGRVIARQLLRSGTSVGAQYREACRARSVAEFISKCESALQELDESIYWLEMILKAGLLHKDVIGPVYSEADQLTAMLVTSVKTAKATRSKTGGKG
jgi:four helix bundle protein